MAGAPVHVRLNETRARQGRRGLHIFWVLGISMVLAALAILIAWAFRWNDLAEVNSAQKAPPAAARSYQEGAPVAAQKPINSASHTQ